MIKVKIFAIGFFLCCSIFKTTVTAQNLKPGIFFLTQNDKECIYSITTSGSKRTYCRGTIPIISISEFKSISDIYHGNKHSFFEITLTPSGQKKIKNVVKTQMKIELGLIINENLVGTINVESGTTMFDKIRIFPYSKKGDLEELKNILQNLLSKN